MGYRGECQDAIEEIIALLEEHGFPLPPRYDPPGAAVMVVRRILRKVSKKNDHPRAPRQQSPFTPSETVDQARRELSNAGEEE